MLSFAYCCVLSNYEFEISHLFIHINVVLVSLGGCSQSIGTHLIGYMGAMEGDFVELL